MPDPRHTRLGPAGVPLRPDLDSLPGYVPGRPPSARQGRAFKLSSNELPWSPLPAVLLAGGDALAGANRYPDAVGARLVRRLAAQVGVPEDRLVVGGGSIALLQLLVQTVTSPGEAVVFAWRSYEAYPIVVQVSGARPVAVPLHGQAHDLPALAAAVRRTGARMVFVCNPNNPTGTSVTAQSLEDFVAAVPSDCLVVLDEAYLEFDDDPHRPAAVELARAHANVAVLRTFSKAYGLAGLRVGYCVAPPDVAAAMRRVALPFGVSGVAEAMAIAALDNWESQAPRVAAVIERRAGLTAALRALGFVVPDSRTNFIWLPLGDRATAFEEALAEAGVSVRTFAGEGVRITIGEPDALSAVIEVAGAFSDRLATTLG